jgi:beta-glucosidase
MPNAKILFIGDSITQGWETNGKEVWEKYYGKRNALNLGVSGDRTQHVLWRLDHGNIDNLNPKLAVIMIGTNNIGQNDPQEIADGILAINAKLKVKLPNTKVVVLAIFPRSPTKEDPKRQAVARTNEILKEHEGTTGYRYVDIGKEFLEADGSISKEIMNDYLHLTPKGYEIWARSIEPVVAGIAGPLQ